MSTWSGGMKMPRREFLQQSAALAAVTAAGLPAAPIIARPGAGGRRGETVTWTSCVVNCGSRCPLRVVSKGGRVVRLEPESDVADCCAVPQARACQRGRAMRSRLYSESACNTR